MIGDTRQTYPILEDFTFNNTDFKESGGDNEDRIRWVTSTTSRIELKDLRPNFHSLNGNGATLCVQEVGYEVSGSLYKDRFPCLDYGEFY